MIVKNGLTLAAILIGIALGYVLYQSISDLKSENAKQVHANQLLRDQVARLQEQLKPLTPVSDFKGTLVNDCLREECLIEMGDGYDSYLIGVGSLKGFYRSVQRTAWEQTKNCDTLVLTGGSGELVREYVELIDRGNSVNSMDSQGRVEFNLDFSEISAIDQDKIVRSVEDEVVELVVLIPLPGGKDAAVCHSFAKILQVK